MILPDRGATVDQLASGAGTLFRSGSQISLERAINRFLDRGPELQRAAAVRASRPRTMHEHFADLFARYETLATQPALVPVTGGALPPLDAELALARSAVRIG